MASTLHPHVDPQLASGDALAEYTINMPDDTWVAFHVYQDATKPDENACVAFVDRYAPLRSAEPLPLSAHGVAWYEAIASAVEAWRALMREQHAGDDGWRVFLDELPPFTPIAQEVAYGPDDLQYRFSVFPVSYSCGIGCSMGMLVAVDEVCAFNVGAVYAPLNKVVGEGSNDMEASQDAHNALREYIVEGGTALCENCGNAIVGAKGDVCDFCEDILPDCAQDGCDKRGFLMCNDQPYCYTHYRALNPYNPYLS